MSQFAVSFHLVFVLATFDGFAFTWFFSGERLGA